VSAPDSRPERVRLLKKSLHSLSAQHNLFVEGGIGAVIRASIVDVHQTFSLARGNKEGRSGIFHACDSCLLLSEIALHEAEEIILESQRIRLFESGTVWILAICDVRETNLYQIFEFFLNLLINL
jgi:hypothetical protein